MEYLQTVIWFIYLSAITTTETEEHSTPPPYTVNSTANTVNSAPMTTTVNDTSYMTETQTSMTETRPEKYTSKPADNSTSELNAITTDVDSMTTGGDISTRVFMTETETTVTKKYAETSTIVLNEITTAVDSMTTGGDISTTAIAFTTDAGNAETEVITTTTEHFTKAITTHAEGEVITSTTTGDISTNGNVSLSDSSRTNTGVIVGVTLTVIIVCAAVVIVLVIVWYRRRNQHNGQSADRGGAEESRRKPKQNRKPENQVDGHIYENVVSAESSMSKSFMETSRACYDDKFTAVADLQANQSKNRYANFVPFDDSRVKLPTSDTMDQSDYINASWVPDADNGTTYIATQGPLINTLASFWLMVWNNNCKVIVMVTDASEYGHEMSFEYWTTNQSDFNGLHVSFETQNKANNIISREFVLTKGEERKRISQYQIIGWSSTAICDLDPCLLLDIFSQATLFSDAGSPVIVHCGGGIGRTGIFIALSRCIQRMVLKQPVDIYKTCLDLMQHRCCIIQTDEQYNFIIKCVEDVEAKFKMNDVASRRISGLYEQLHFQDNPSAGSKNLYYNM